MPDPNSLESKRENLRQAAYILARPQPLYPALEKFMETEVPVEIARRFWDLYRENQDERAFISEIESLALQWK